MTYNLGTASGRIEIDGKAGAAGFKVVETAANTFFDVVQRKVDSVERLGRRMQIAGGAGVTGFGIAVKAAADFEKQMSGVRAVTNSSEKEFDSLREKALQLGADTTYSASEAALAIEELAKAGIPVEDILNGAAEGAVALAAAGGISLPEAATIASNAMNQFGLGADQVTKVADILAGVANTSAADVSTLGQSLSQVGAVANLSGLSFRDTTIALGQLADAGIQGSDAGTSLKTMLTNLIPATDIQKNKFKELGLLTENLTDANETLQSVGLKPTAKSMDEVRRRLTNYVDAMGKGERGTVKNVKAVEDLLLSQGGLKNAFFDQEGNIKSLDKIQGVLNNSLKDMTSEQKLAALEVLFGSDALRASAILAENGAKGYRNFSKAVGETKASEVAKTRMDNLSGAVEEFGGSMETALITIGNVLLPAVTAIVKGATKMVNAFNNLPGPIKTAIAVVVGIVSVLLILVGTLLASITTIAVFVAQWYALKVIAIATGYLKTFYTVMRAGAGIMAAHNAALAVATTRTSRLARITVIAGKAFLFFGKMARLAWKALLGPVGIVIAVVLAIIALAVLLYNKWEPFRDLVDKIAGILKGAFLDAWEKIKQAMQVARDALVRFGGYLKDTFGPAIRKVGEFLRDGFLAGVDKVKDLFNNKLIPAFRRVKDSVQNDVLPALDRAKDRIGRAFGGAVERAKGVFEDKFLPTLRKVKSTVEDTLIPALESARRKIGNAFSNGIDKVKRSIEENLLPALSNVKKRIEDDLIPAFEDARKAVGDAFGEAFEEIRKTFEEEIIPAFEDVWKTIQEDLIPAFQDLREIIEEEFGPALEALRPVLELLGKFLGAAILLPIYGLIAGLIALSGFIMAVADSFSVLVEGVSGQFSGFVELISGFINVIVGLFTYDFAQMWEGVKQIFTGGFEMLLGVVTALFAPIIAPVKSFVAQFGQTFVNMWNGVRNFTTNSVNMVRNTITNVFNVVVGFITGWANRVRNAVVNAWNTVVNNVRAAVGRIRGNVTDGFNAVVSAVSGAGGRIISAIIRAFNSVVNNARSGMSRMTGAVGDGLDRAVGFVQALPGRILSVFANFGSLLFNAGAALVDGLVNGIQSRIEAAASAAASIANRVRNFFPGSPVKEGPLTSFNRGAAGKKLMNMLAEGLSDTSAVDRAIRGVATYVKGMEGVIRPAMVAQVSASVTNAPAQARPLGALSAGAVKPPRKPQDDKAKKLRFLEGELELKNGKTYIRGVAEEVVDENDNTKARAARRGGSDD